MDTVYADKELFERIAEGDERAFEQLFNRYLPRIQPVVLQIVKSGAAADDLVQDIFLRLWLGREKLAEIDHPKNYIFRIVYNQSFKYLKHRLVEEKATARLMAAGAENEGAPSLVELLDMEEVRRLVDAGIQALPKQARQIYRLNRVGGFKPLEIAGQLGLSVQTVRNSLTRSTKFIKEHLEQQGVVLPLLLIALSMHR